MDVYATWYSSGIAPAPMTFEMTAYKGGTMSKGTAETGDYNKYNYYNEGGERLYNDTYRVLITTTGGNGTYDQGGYTKVATIVYDRIKHSASVTVLAAAPANTRSSHSVKVPFRPEEKPFWTPVIVNTYSDNYQGKRR